VEQAQADVPVLKWRHILLVFLIALLLLGISGVGGYGYQDTDWLKHNAILKDLVTRPWPVVYRLRGEQAPLVYYIAYYLPAALLGKLGEWTLANQALFLWSLIGLVLAMLWFLILSRQAAFTVVLLFVLFSGLDVVGQVIARSVVAPLRPEIWSILRWDHIEQWSVGWQYSSNVTLLFWVPHQALAGWIGAGLLMHMILHSSARPSSPHEPRNAPLVEFRRHVTAISDAGTILHTPAIEEVRGVGHWGLPGEQAEIIMLQYLGSSSAPFFRFLAKEG
jgi:hypothetical protein